MAVGGTVSKPIWLKDGMYLSMLADNTITLGNVVRLTTTGTDTCDVGAAASSHYTNIGVAVGGDRYSRTATDNTVAAGSYVTVATRGIVYVYTGTSTIVRGSYVESAATGTVDLAGTTGYTIASAGFGDVLGIALDANSSAATTIRVKLLRG
jgi:hypothetical protein